jgi:hypothetical protein
LVIARLGRARVAFFDAIASLSAASSCASVNSAMDFSPAVQRMVLLLFDDAHGPPDIAALHAIRPNEFGTAFAA